MKTVHLAYFGAISLLLVILYLEVKTDFLSIRFGLAATKEDGTFKEVDDNSGASSHSHASVSSYGGATKRNKDSCSSYSNLPESGTLNLSDKAVIGRMTTGKKVLVTGGGGFIGSHVARHCLELGFNVVVVDDLSGGFHKNLPTQPEGKSNTFKFVQADLKDADFVSKLFEEEKFDVVYHLAAYAAEGLSHFIRNYNYKNNLIASTNLITQAVRVGTVKKFVFTSSIAVYGSGRTPMTEDMEPEPEDPYGISKQAVEQDLKAAKQMWGMDYVVFRPHNVYGPGQNIYDKYRNVVGIFLNQLQAGKSLTVFGDGTQTRKFSYVDDVAYPIAVSGVLDHVGGEVFNVGGDIATTVNELAEVVLETWDGKLQGKSADYITHLDARNEVAHAESDHQKLNCYFPNLPKPIGLRDGMKVMVEWSNKTGQYFKPVEFEAVEILKKMPKSWVKDGMKEVPAFNHDAKDNYVEDTLVKNKPETTTRRRNLRKRVTK